jgi:hypothetical protein
VSGATWNEASIFIGPAFLRTTDSMGFSNQPICATENAAKEAALLAVAESLLVLLKFLLPA